MSRSGSEVLVTGVASTMLASLLSFVIVSVSISATRNKRRAELVEARRLQGIPDAIVVADEHGDVETGHVVEGEVASGASEVGKRKETAEDKRKKRLKDMNIPVGEIYDGAYGKRERHAGLCYSIFTRKSTVLLHLQWTKVMSGILMVLQIGFLAIQVLRGLYILAFPQFGIAGALLAFVAALCSFHQQSHCCLRWLILVCFLPSIMAYDLLDAATLAMEYACKRDGSPCSKFSAEVVLFFFTLRMISVFITVWLALLTTFLSHEMGCCEDKDVYSYWDMNHDTRTVSLDCVPNKDFSRRRGKSLQEAIRQRKEEIRKQEEAKANAEASDGRLIAHFGTIMSGGGGRRTKKSVFNKQRHPSAGSEKDKLERVEETPLSDVDSDESVVGNASASDKEDNHSEEMGSKKEPPSPKKSESGDGENSSKADSNDPVDL